MILLSPLCGQALPERLVSLFLSVGRKLKEDISILPTVINYGEFLHTRDRDLTPHVTPQVHQAHRNRTFSIDNVLERRQPPLPPLCHISLPLSHFAQGSHAADGQCTLLSRVGLSI